jgi:hypothetical protein
VRSQRLFTLFVLITALTIMIIGAFIPGTTRGASPRALLTPSGFSFLPYAIHALPTATPTITPTPVSVNVIVNGDFENGPAGWNQYSSNSWQLILSQDQLLVTPYSGSWAAWLGGDYDESSLLWQVVTIPSGAPLQFWFWVASEDVCGADIAGVAVNDQAVDAFWLCSANNTGGWVLRNVSLDAYANQIVELVIAAFTDGSLNSNLFVDDVSLGGGSSVERPAGSAVETDVSRGKADLLAASMKASGNESSESAGNGSRLRDILVTFMKSQGD